MFVSGFLHAEHAYHLVVSPATSMGTLQHFVLTIATMLLGVF
jgi:hypothetical protein